MNLNQLRYFATLADLEHYTRAAEKLNISQPTLSHAMSLLEEELGVRLFQKQGRNVVLTKYGKLFLEYVKESLYILDSGISKIQEMTSKTQGVIDLAFIYTLGSEFIPELVGDFLKIHKGLNVRFQFTTGNTTELIQGLKDEKYDVAFCSMVEGEDSMEFIPVGVEKLVAVVPKNHPLADKQQVELEEIASYPQIFYAKNSGLRPTIDRLFEMAQIKPQIAYEILEDGAMAGLVARNFGIAIMPDIPLLKNLNVEVLELHAPVLERQFYMVLSRNNFHTPIVQYFTEYVRKTFAEN